VARCDFDLLCGTALGAGDYLALAARFHTLILDGISNTGGPLRLAFDVLLNMDDGRKFAGFVFMVRGEARASVPLGTYAALFDSLEFSSDGSATIREIVVNDIAVTGTQPPVTIDARTATAVPSVTTPMSTVPLGLTTELDFSDEARHFQLGWVGISGSRGHGSG
jgi:hypothetical protein